MSSVDLLKAVLASGRINQETLDKTMAGVAADKKEIIKILKDDGAKKKLTEANKDGKTESKKAETPNKPIAPRAVHHPGLAP